MNCEAWEESIAGLADGEPATPALTIHLSECSGCSALLQGLRQDQMALRAIGPADEAALLAAQRHVMARVRARGLRRRVYCAGAVAAALGLVMLWPKQPVAPPPAPVIVAKQPTVPAAPVKEQQGPAPVRKPPRAARPPDWEAFLAEFSPPPEPAPPPKPATMQAALRIPTSNPDVIILLFQ